MAFFYHCVEITENKYNLVWYPNDNEIDWNKREIEASRDSMSELIKYMESAIKDLS